tara:strand:+ start:958 stop:1383 length:426 start_codon:yes stop_codon:yes gene_type:complete
MVMDLSQGNKNEIDNVLQKCGWRQTKQRVILLKSIFDGKDKHFSINQINEILKDNKSYFSLTTLYENLNTLVGRGYLKQIIVDKQSFYDTNTTDHIHVFNQEENRIYDYKDYTELHKELPIPACLALLEEYSLVINIKKKK